MSSLPSKCTELELVIHWKAGSLGSSTSQSSLLCNHYSIKFLTPHSEMSVNVLERTTIWARYLPFAQFWTIHKVKFSRPCRVTVDNMAIKYEHSNGCQHVKHSSLKIKITLLSCYKCYTILLSAFNPSRLAPVEHTCMCTGSHTHGDICHTLEQWAANYCARGARGYGMFKLVEQLVL